MSYKEFFQCSQLHGEVIFTIPILWRKKLSPGRSQKLTWIPRPTSGRNGTWTAVFQKPKPGLLTTAFKVMWLIHTNCATHSSPPPRWWNSVGEQVEKNSMRFFLLSWFPGGRVDMFKHGIYSALIYLSDCAVQDSWLGMVRESKPVPHLWRGCGLQAVLQLPAFGRLVCRS